MLTGNRQLTLTGIRRRHEAGRPLTLPYTHHPHTPTRFPPKLHTCSRRLAARTGSGRRFVATSPAPEPRPGCEAAGEARGDRPSAAADAGTGRPGPSSQEGRCRRGCSGGVSRPGARAGGHPAGGGEAVAAPGSGAGRGGGGQTAGSKARSGGDPRSLGVAGAGAERPEAGALRSGRSQAAAGPVEREAGARSPARPGRTLTSPPLTYSSILWQGSGSSASSSGANGTISRLSSQPGSRCTSPGPRAGSEAAGGRGGPRPAAHGAWRRSSSYCCCRPAGAAPLCAPPRTPPNMAAGGGGACAAWG